MRPRYVEKILAKITAAFVTRRLLNYRRTIIYAEQAGGLTNEATRDKATRRIINTWHHKNTDTVRAQYKKASKLQCNINVLKTSLQNATLN